MTRKLILTCVVLFSLSATVWAQKPKSNAKKPTATSSSALSNAEKMGYARTNKYWGPGTYYCFAPGVTHMKMVNTAESAMRDLTGISPEDCYAELAKQGFEPVPVKDVPKWLDYNKSDKDLKVFTSPDKSYFLRPFLKDMEKSAQPDFRPFAIGSVRRSFLIPKQDSLKVIEMAWQYMCDLNEMKILLSSFGSTFKKANPKACPIERAGSSGWNSMRAGTFVLVMENGKPRGVWDSNENIIHRTIGKPEFELLIMGMETDFWYSMKVKLQKEGYVINYDVMSATLLTLEPGSNWIAEHKIRAEQAKGGETMDKQAIEAYKKAPLPPVLEDLNKLLHIR